MVGTCRLNHLQCPPHELDAVNFVGLEFTQPKNGVQGEIIGLGHSANPSFCPVVALLNRVKYLHHHHAHPTTPLYSYFHHFSWHTITAAHLTTTLWQTVSILSQHFGIQPSDISFCSLRSSGAMALLCAGIDTDLIRLLGCWHSDEMLCYLTVQAFPVVARLALAMLQHGHFTLIPNNPLHLLPPCAG